MERRPSSRSSGRRRPEPKTEVHCPDCGASYFLAEEMLDRKVQCRQCRRVFIPANILRQATRRSTGHAVSPSALVGLILAVGVILGGALIVHNKLRRKEEPVAGGQGPAAPDPAVVQRRAAAQAAREVLERWITAIATRNDQSLEFLTDVEAFYQATPEASRPKDAKGQPLSWAALDPAKKVAWRQQLFQELLDGELGAPLRGKVLAAGSTEIAQGDPFRDPRIEMTASFREGEVGGSTWLLGFTLANLAEAGANRYLVQHLEVRKAPASKTDPSKRRPPPAPKGMQDVEVKTGEDGKTIQEHPIIPMDHLEETPPELRAEIDRLVKILADPEAPPREVSPAIKRIREIGRPAFPRLLNLFYEVHQGADPESYDSRTILSRLIKQCIVYLTMCDFGFDPTGEAAADVEAVRLKRLSALKQYYAWWARHHSQSYWDEMQKLRDSEEEKL